MNPQMRQLFLSDAHLGALPQYLNNQLENRVIRIIDYCESNQIRIHILGDLLDYWMEYPDYIPSLGKKVLNRFSDFHKKILPGYYITGNHDNWTYGYFDEIGFQVEHEFAEMVINEKKILILHGDGLKDPDMKLPRPFLHQVLRNPLFISFYQTVFGGESGNHLMKTFSEYTRSHSDLQTEKLSKWAQQLLYERSFDYILAGHDHVPRVETNSAGTYINTGAFYLHGTAVMYNNGEFELVIWNDELCHFKPFGFSVNNQTVS